MKVLKVQNGEIKEVEYPNIDISKPVYDLDESIQYYFINEIDVENTDVNRYDKKFKDFELTNEVHSEYAHLKIAKKEAYLSEKSQEEILNRLNAEFGEWFDYQYFPQTRTKHIVELQSDKVTSAKKKEIADLQSWLIDCYFEKELRETNYKDNGIFPDFGNWPVKPVLTIKK